LVYKKTSGLDLIGAALLGPVNEKIITGHINRRSSRLDGVCPAGYIPRGEIAPVRMKRG